MTIQIVPAAAAREDLLVTTLLRCLGLVRAGDLDPKQAVHLQSLHLPLQQLVGLSPKSPLATQKSEDEDTIIWVTSEPPLPVVS